MRAFVVARAREAMGFVLGLFGLLLMVLLGSYDPHDASLNSVPATAGGAHNLFGIPGAYAADLLIQSLGWAAFVIALVPMFWGWRLGAQRKLGNPLFRTVLALWGVFLVAMALAGLTDASTDPLAPLPGGGIGQVLLRGVGNLFGAEPMVATVAAVGGGLVLFLAAGLSIGEWIASFRALGRGMVNGVRLIRQGARNGVDSLRRHGRTAAQAASVAVDASLRGDKRDIPRFDEAVQVTPLPPPASTPAGFRRRPAPRQTRPPPPAEPTSRSAPFPSSPRPNPPHRRTRATNRTRARAACRWARRRGRRATSCRRSTCCRCRRPASAASSWTRRRFSAMPASWKACWAISACAARSRRSIPARSSPCTNWNRPPAPNRPASSALPTTSPAR